MLHTPQPAASAPRPDARAAWPWWAGLLVSVAFWAAHVAGSEVAGRVAALAFCHRHLGVWTDPWCDYGDAGSGAIALLVLGLIGFLLGFSRFERWSRVYFYVTFELALFAWAAAIAFVPHVPFVVQVGVPVVVALRLSRHVTRLETAHDHATRAEPGAADA